MAVLCDFDGTITLIDTFEYILRKYSTGDWMKLEEQYETGKIGFQEYIRRERKLVKTPKTILLADLQRAIPFRRHFENWSNIVKEVRYTWAWLAPRSIL